MEKCESAPGALDASSRVEVLGRRSRSRVTHVVGGSWRDAGSRGYPPSCKDALRWGELMENTVAAIIITVFFLKLQAIQKSALGSCFLRAQTGCLYYGWT